MATVSCLEPEGAVLRLEETVGLTLHVPNAVFSMQASVQRQMWQSKVHAYGPPRRVKTAAAAASLSLRKFKQRRQNQMGMFRHYPPNHPPPLLMRGRTHGERVKAVSC